MTEQSRTEQQAASPAAQAGRRGESADGVSPAAPQDDDILEALRDVVDPELGINVVDLGLVYGVSVDADRASPRST